jgi:hypothetical protein
MNAPIRLIATRWLYDYATKTLFSSDLFTHLWRDTAAGPWIVTDADNDRCCRKSSLYGRRFGMLLRRSAGLGLMTLIITRLAWRAVA